MVKAIYPQELIGKHAEIIVSRNESLLGKRGKIVGETKSTLRLDMGGKICMVLKNTVTIRLSTGEVLEGHKLVARPEERIKGIKDTEG